MRSYTIFAILATMTPAIAGIGQPLAALEKTYGEIVETSAYRPDLFATSHKFKSGGATIEATVLPDVVSQLDVYFKEDPCESMETLLERYSGKPNWQSRPLSDQDFAHQYPLFSATDKRNMFFVADGVFALAQRDVADHKLVLRIQARSYLPLLKEYRRKKAGE